MSQGYTNPFGTFLPRIAAYAGLTLPNAKMVNGFVAPGASGANDLYTVPAGKRVLALSLFAYNATVGSITIYPTVKIGGTYYQLGTSVAVTPGTSTNGDPGDLTFNYVAEAGEILAFNATALGMNAWFKGIEFDDVSGLKSAKLTSLANGDNTLYTVPTGKSAQTFPLYAFPTYDQTGTVGISNNSGGSRIYNLFSVPSGGSSGATNKTVNALTVTNTTITKDVTVIAPCMNSGDFVVVNTNAATATQFAWMTVCEVP